ncbi:hypothetical protein ACRJ4B_15950 [Streptomyces sp. GTA36]
MIEWNLALGAAVLMASLAVGAVLSRLLFVPFGSHRAVRAAEETTPLADLMRPLEMPVNDEAWCSAEQRVTWHAFHQGGRQCWTCRTFTAGEGL